MNTATLTITDPATATTKLTPVQRDVLARLALEPDGRATVGRGHPFKCSRTTARALRNLGMVATNAGHSAYASGDFVIALRAPSGAP